MRTKGVTNTGLDDVEGVDPAVEQAVDRHGSGEAPEEGAEEGEEERAEDAAPGAVLAGELVAGAGFEAAGVQAESLELVHGWGLRVLSSVGGGVGWTGLGGGLGGGALGGGGGDARVGGGGIGDPDARARAHSKTTGPRPCPAAHRRLRPLTSGAGE